MKEKWTGDDMADQTGRIAIVTGANTGLGFETARVLAERNATVVLACRNDDKGRDAVKRIKAEHPKARAVYMRLDLSSLEDVQRFAKEFRRRYDHLNMLINNAGVMMPPTRRPPTASNCSSGPTTWGTSPSPASCWTC